MIKRLAFAGILLLAAVQQSGAQPLFSLLSPAETGVSFQNKLVESPNLNIITYEYYYNGGGVATADFNNDGLTDIFLTANISSNTLYLNKGNWKFEDATRAAGLEGRRGWKTGVSVADINGDGFLDIYVCYSGDVDEKFRKNQLFINNKDGSFTDRAEEMGAADAGYTTQALFFDMDRDGDLDLFVLNHNVKSLRNFDAAFVKKMMDPGAGDRLYRNDAGRFADITAAAGIISNPLGYGLSVLASDINRDGWPDLYVTNDYVEEDYLYINNQDGTFTESLKRQMGHISNFSMGADIADINNDGWMDVFTLDMLPADNKRQKLLYAPDNYELYNNQLENGFHHQLMRNMLQLNNGNGTFSEVGQLSGVSATDWSWSALMADFDNDGFRDIFVTNGYGRDMINRDFMKFYANERLKYLRGETSERMFQMLQGIKTTPLHNYFFRNKGNLRFADHSLADGFSNPGLFNGAAYADLDNDGDLDLVVNCLNDTARLYRNNLVEKRTPGNYIQLSLEMEGMNRHAIGAVASVYAGNKVIVQEYYPVRGFQSSMNGPLHIGVPFAKIDSVIIRWPDGNSQKEANIAINKKSVITCKKSAAATAFGYPDQYVFNASSAVLPFFHRSEKVNDFKIQPLMPVMISGNGPHMTKADINNDGLEDVYVCGGRGQSGRLFLQQADGSFKAMTSFPQEINPNREETDAVFFDADGDKDLDLYVVSGNYHLADPQALLPDQLFINNNGSFTIKKNALPEMKGSKSCVAVADIDNDNDLDIFIGGRVVPGRYPESPESYILVNNGKGFFENQTSLWAPALQKAGMITDAVWTDINNDSRKDLMITGEWMAIRVFINDGKELEEKTDSYFNQSLKGWWNRLLLADMDMDGDLDIVAGNWGLNSQMQASASQPVTLYHGDYDQNGSVDPLLCYYIEGNSYPMASRDELTDQVVSWRQKFPTYDAYSSANIRDILPEEQLKQTDSLQANFFETAWFEFSNGAFTLHSLPAEANYSPVYAMAAEDFNGDGKTDLLLAGNLLEARIKIGRMDANRGVLLLGDGKGNFLYAPPLQSGLSVEGQVREILPLKVAGKKSVCFGISQASTQLFNY